MICTLDACVLVLWASIDTDETLLARLDHLLEMVGRADGALILPTPAVSELLVRTDTGTAAWLNALQRRSVVRIAPFDLRAAAECAFIHQRAVAAGGKRFGTKKNEHFQKIKVDRQIVAIAKVAGSDLLVTDDENLIAVASFVGLGTVRPGDLDLPESAKQSKLNFNALPSDNEDASAADTDVGDEAPVSHAKPAPAAQPDAC